MGVRNSEALREAHAAVQGEVVAFGLRVGQSRPIYDALEALAGGSAFEREDPVRQRIVRNADPRRAARGRRPRGDEPRRFNEIQAELAEPWARASPTTCSTRPVPSRSPCATPPRWRGCPPASCSLAAQYGSSRRRARRPAPRRGPWRITLDAAELRSPSWSTRVRRDLRETLYRAYVTRASEGELDNTPLIERSSALRHEMAGLLGFAATRSSVLSAKMAPRRRRRCDELLERLRGRLVRGGAARARGAAPRFAKVHCDARPRPSRSRSGTSRSGSERLREERFDYSEEALRPYFPLPSVLDGLFALALRLFGVRVESRRRRDARLAPRRALLRVRGEAGEAIAAFFLDPYSRPGEKRGGAWMDECVVRSRMLAGPGESCRLPVAYLVCNQTPPVDGRPSLHVLRRGADALPRVRSRPAAHADAGRLRRSLRASATSSGTRSSCRASSWRTGATTARPCVGLVASRRHRRAAARRALREDRRGAHLSRRQRDAAPALLRHRWIWRCIAESTLGGRRARRLRRAAARRRADDGAPAAPRGSLPLQLRPHLRGRLRGGLLQLQVGRGAVRGRLRRPSRRPGSTIPIAVARDRSALSRHRARARRAAAARWRSSAPSAGARRPPRPCCDTPGLAGA